MRTLRILIDNRDGSTYSVSAILPGHPHLTAAVPADAFPRNPPVLGQPGLEANGLEAFGEALHAVVCRPALRAAWDAVAGGPARVLLDVRPPELRDLPWELLLDGARQRWMFGNPQQPIVRAAAAAFLELATPLQLPVRMLVLVGAPEEADRDVLGVDLELEAIYGAVRELGCLWQVDVLDGADVGRVGIVLAQDPYVAGRLGGLGLTRIVPARSPAAPPHPRARPADRRDADPHRAGGPVPRAEVARRPDGRPAPGAGHGRPRRGPCSGAAHRTHRVPDRSRARRQDHRGPLVRPRGVATSAARGPRRSAAEVTLTCNRFLEAFAMAVPESLGTQAAAQAAEVFIAELAQLEAATRYGGPVTAPSHGGAPPLLSPMPMTPGRTMPGIWAGSRLTRIRRPGRPGWPSPACDRRRHTRLAPHGRRWIPRAASAGAPRKGKGPLARP